MGKVDQSLNIFYDLCRPASRSLSEVATSAPRDSGQEIASSLSDSGASCREMSSKAQWKKCLLCRDLERRLSFPVLDNIKRPLKFQMGLIVIVNKL